MKITSENNFRKQLPEKNKTKKKDKFDKRLDYHLSKCHLYQIAT